AYGRYVEAERDRLSAEHPLFRTQYALETIAGEAGFFSPALQTQLHGVHPRRHAPLPGATYVGALDVAGSGVECGFSPAKKTRKGVRYQVSGVGENKKSPNTQHLAPNTRGPDSTVLLVARVEWAKVAPETCEAALQVEKIY